MSLLPEAKGRKEEALVNQGKAIARGIAEANAQKDKNMAKAEKRKETIFRNAVAKVFHY